MQCSALLDYTYILLSIINIAYPDVVQGTIKHSLFLVIMQVTMQVILQEMERTLDFNYVRIRLW